MKKLLGVLFIGLLACGPAWAWTHPDNSEGPDDTGSLPNAWSLHDRERAALAQVADRLHKGDTNYTALAEHLHRILNDTGYSTLTPVEQHYAWLVYGLTLFNDRQFEIARGALEHASGMDGAGAVDFEYRMKNALALNDYGGAATAATALAQRWPAALAHYDDSVFVTIVSETQKSPDTAGLAAGLSAALATANHPLPAAHS